MHRETKKTPDVPGLRALGSREETHLEVEL
jgi:hypothetical protein